MFDECGDQPYEGDSDVIEQKFNDDAYLRGRVVAYQQALVNLIAARDACNQAEHRIGTTKATLISLMSRLEITHVLVGDTLLQYEDGNIYTYAAPTVIQE